MKNLLALLLFATSAHATGTHLASIEPDQDAYVPGSRAVIFLPMKRPTTAGMEFFLKLDGRPTKATVVPLSLDLAVAISDRFPAPQESHWNLTVFQQDRKEQLSLSKSIAGYSTELATRKLELEKETDPDSRAVLENRIRELGRRIEILETKAEEGRVLVDRVSEISRVLPASSSLLAVPELFTLRAGRTPANYLVGESATFFALPLVNFRGPDGVRENVLRGKFLGLTYYGTPVLTETQFTLPPFTSAHLGAQNFTVDFLIRSKRQADRLRAAANLALAKRDTLREDLAASVDPTERAWLQNQIAEMQSAADALMLQLEEILTPVDTGDTSFQVLP